MKKYYYPLISCWILMAACQKETIEAPTFDITTGKTTYKVGENIIFNISGNPDFISFFSGEQGSRYENRGRTTAAGTPVVKFTSVRANGTQPNSLALMVSSDFQGAGADQTAGVSNIGKATW